MESPAGQQAALAAWATASLRSGDGTYAKIQVVKLSNNFREATALVQAQLPRAVPPGQVLVRRCFVGINASDINYTAGRYSGSPAEAAAKLPFDAGFESVGVVAAVGPGVADLKPGDAVATLADGFSEFGLVAARMAIRVPAPTPEVLALLTSGLTASIALEEVGGLLLMRLMQGAAQGRASSSGSGDVGAASGCIASSSAASSSAAAGAARGGRPAVALVTAAAGGTGQFAVQLAKLAGCHVVATCSDDAKAALLRRLGADRVVNHRSQDLKAILKAEYPKGLDLVYESVGGAMFDTCVNALADRGRLIIIGMMSRYGEGWPPSNHPGLPEKLLWKSAAVCGFFLLRYAPLFRPHLAALVALHAAGRLQVAVDPKRFVGVAAVPEAVDWLQGGRSLGKVVVQLAPELPPGLERSKL